MRGYNQYIKYAKYINESIENTGLFIRSNYIYVSFVGVVGLPLFYVVWKELFPQAYESLTMRLIGSILFFPLILVKYWSVQLRPYFKYYSVLLLVYTVVFFFFMLIKNEHSEIWTLSTVCGLVLLILLAYEWFVAIVSFVLGLAIACGLVLISSDQDLVLIKYEHLPIYLFIVIAGSLFNYRKNIILQEKYNLLKAVSSSISDNMDMSLVKVKIAIEDLAEDMSVSKSYAEKEVMEVLSGKLKETSDELIKTQDELVKSEKMAAMGRAVARIAHELNTPICAARSSAQNISSQTKKVLGKFETENPEVLKASVVQYKEDMDKMEKVLMGSVSRAAKLVRSFKEISTDQMLVRKKEFELSAYVKTSLESMSDLLKRQNIIVNLQCDEIFMYSDPGLFYQIIENLITNAQKYAYDDDGGAINIRIKDGHDKIILVFTDYGKGIPQENLSKIFDAFFTTGGGSGGTGLGLNIVNRIVVNQLYGTITCKSKLGKGAVFTIIIPK